MLPRPMSPTTPEPALPRGFGGVPRCDCMEPPHGHNVGPSYQAPGRATSGGAATVLSPTDNSIPGPCRPPRLARPATRPGGEEPAAPTEEAPWTSSCAVRADGK